jgi:hypothetical protein
MIPALSLVEWIVRSLLCVITLALVGSALYYDVRTFVIYSVTGPRGPRGGTGILGLIGAKGLRGDIGPQGFFGPTGPLGVTGPTGGYGLPGPTGIIGPTGMTGPTGNPNPLARGSPGNTGATGISQTGPVGPHGPLTGPQGPLGPTGSIIPSALGFTYAGQTGQLGAAINVSFTPSPAVTFPLVSSYIVGPDVRTIGANTPALITLGMQYKIAAALVATVSTVQTGTPTAALTAQITLTAKSSPSTLPVSFATELVTVAVNQNTKIYSIQMRLIASYTAPSVPILIGFNLQIICPDIPATTGTLLISVATLTITPV